MQFSDLSELFTASTVELICDTAGAFRTGDDIRIEKIDENRAYVLAPQSDKKVLSRFSNQAYADDWELVRGSEYFARISDVRDDNRRLVVEIVSGLTVLPSGKPLEIAVTDKALGGQNFGLVSRHIMNDYVLQMGGKKYVVVARSAYKLDEDDLKSFQIVNGRFRYSVTEDARVEFDERVVDRPEEKVFAIKSGESPFRRENAFLSLWEGGINVSDISSVGIASAETQAFISGGLEKYLSLWQIYAEVEYKYIQDLAESAGVLHYHKESISYLDRTMNLKILNPGCFSDFDRVLKELSGKNNIRTICLPGFSGKKEFIATAEYDDKAWDPEKHTLLVKVKGDRDDTCNKILNGGEIEPSIAGAKTQYERRMDAFEEVMKGKAAMPALPMLISGKLPSHRQELKTMLPLSDEVRKYFKGRTPTGTQTAAISIALNTPDIAIIQGPPGTGKTTVINAIMAALSEKEKNPDLLFGENLLTAYQRDATRNLAEKLEIYGLPVFVYTGGDDDREQAANKAALRNWIAAKREFLEKSPSEEDETSLKEFAQLDMLKVRLELLGVGLTERCSREFCVRTMESFLSDLSEIDVDFPKRLDIVNRAKNLRKALERENDDVSRRIRRQMALRLPEDERSLEDMESDAVKHLLQFFSRPEFSGTVHNCVEKLSKAYDERPLRTERIRYLKDTLLVELKGKSPLLPDDKWQSAIQQLLRDAIKSISSRERSDEDRIRVEYLEAFSDDSYIERSIREFITVISSTHQKVVSEEVLGNKHKPEPDDPEADDDDVDDDDGDARDTSSKRAARSAGSDNITYENVLVDEAARSCPPDLLIPLALARKRIIMVGDHKQLPQFISDGVYDTIDDLRDDEKALLKESMFEHMVEAVKSLEKADGISRFVTLDNQFRMPQTLGDFISKQFYEKDGTPVHSPLGNSEQFFGNNLAYLKGCHIGWLHVGGRGNDFKERRFEKSLCREAEAKQIVELLHKVVERSRKPETYSYGLITFYSGQEKLLRRKIAEDAFLSEFLERDDVKFNLGTVDAFQGLEFDIVILSLVRSNTDYKTGGLNFGFTRDPHRLCVALSRAKRCMIIAGDKKMMENKAAKESVPALAEFYAICAGKEVSDARLFTDQDFAD